MLTVLANPLDYFTQTSKQWRMASAWNLAVDYRQGITLFSGSKKKHRIRESWHVSEYKNIKKNQKMEERSIFRGIFGDLSLVLLQ